VLIREYAIWGVFVHPYMLALVLAIAASRPFCLVLNRCGFYRYVWHPGLFDMAVFFLLYGVFVWVFVPDIMSAL
jgi:hypothetical protein